MTPNNEAKAKLFALYWGIPVLVDVDNSGKEQLYPIEQSNMYRIPESHLLLRSIEQLEDEECYNIGKLITEYYSHTIDVGGGFPFINKEKFDIDINLSFEHLINIHTSDGVISYQIQKFNLSPPIEVYDYLRSIGIALPITCLDENHKPVTASVSEQVEWGWVKLTTNK